VSDARDAAPLLLLEGARIAAGGITSEPLSARGGSQKLSLVGDFRPLFRLLAKDATLVAGRVELAGLAVRDTAFRVGFAPCDPVLVPEWTPERYLTESARLLGFSERDARTEVECAVATVSLGSFARHRFDVLSPVLRRAVLLAHAILGSPDVLCAESPFADLDGGSQSEMFTYLERVARGRRLIVSSRSLPSEGPERALLRSADWVIVESRGRIATEGPTNRILGQARRYAATVTRGGDAFVAALTARGITVGAGAVTHVPPPPDAPPGADPVEVALELPHGATPNDVLLAAKSAGAPLVELVPIA
jgi:ABC-type cobalamin/Fe3+-siderophores transport system ATPase subunit